jgi:chromosome segregation ATPase
MIEKLGHTSMTEPLIRALLNAEREVNRSKQLVQTSRQKLQDAENKINLVNETKQRSDDAKKAQPGLEDAISDLERLLATVESLAATENSRRNATPEIRAKNREWAQALERVQKDDRTANQLLTDCSFLESEIEQYRSQFEDRKKAASIRMETHYKSVQAKRQELAQTRRDRLISYLERMGKHSSTEIEFVKLNTHVTVYRALLGSVQMELNALNSRDESALANLRREVDKIETMIRNIEPHTVVSAAEVRKIEEQCEAYQREINQTEALLKDTIIKMSQLEHAQDQLNKDIQKAEDENEQYRSSLQNAETETPDLEQEVENSKNRSQLNAQAELARLEEALRQAKQSCESNERRLLEKQRSVNDQKIPKETETMINRIQKERIRLEERMRQLQNEKLDVSAQLARRSSRDAPVPGTVDVEELGL